MNTEIKIKQGESCYFVGELKDDDNNVLNLSSFDRIRILVQSPGMYRIVLNEDDFVIVDNKIIFKLTSLQTAQMRRTAIIEVEVIIDTATVIGQSKSDIIIEDTLISKI